MQSYRDGGVNLEPAKNCLAQKCSAGGSGSSGGAGTVSLPDRNHGHIASHITQAVTFSTLTAADWTGDTKEVYEKGFGATLGIYNTTTDTYSAGCSVTSTLSRRTASVSYSAIVTADKAGDAQTNAQVLESQPELLVAGIASAKEATGKASVNAPNLGAVSAQPPAIQTGSDTAGAEQSDAAASGDSSSSLSAGAVIGIVVGVLAVVGFIIVAVAMLSSSTAHKVPQCEQLGDPADLEPLDGDAESAAEEANPARQPGDMHGVV